MPSDPLQTTRILRWGSCDLFQATRILWQTLSGLIKTKKKIISNTLWLVSLHHRITCSQWISNYNKSLAGINFLNTFQFISNHHCLKHQHYYGPLDYSKIPCNSLYNQTASTHSLSNKRTWRSKLNEHTASTSHITSAVSLPISSQNL